MQTEDVFREINTVLTCQLNIKHNYKCVELENAIQNTSGLFLLEDMQVLTGIPILDITLNIDWFTADFDDRKKIL